MPRRSVNWRSLSLMVGVRRGETMPSDRKGRARLHPPNGYLKQEERLIISVINIGSFNSKKIKRFPLDCFAI
jgi:hypothetical protein